MADPIEVDGISTIEITRGDTVVAEIVNTGGSGPVTLEGIYIANPVPSSTSAATDTGNKYQLNAVAIYSDGSSVTTGFTWAVESGTSLTVAGSVATIASAGNTTVSATLGSDANALIITVPA